MPRGKHRKVTAAEHYASLPAGRWSMPRCECHGQLMRWSPKADMPRGGIERCAVRMAEAQRRYRWPSDVRLRLSRLMREAQLRRERDIRAGEIELRRRGL